LNINAPRRPQQQEQQFRGTSDINSVADLAAWIQREMTQVENELQELAEMTFAVQVSSEAESLVKQAREEAAVPRGDRGRDDVLLSPAEAQEVVPAAEFLEETASGIPGLLPPEAFCDQLENTLPRQGAAGADRRTRRLAQLCRQLFPAAAPVGGVPTPWRDVVGRQYDSAIDEVDSTVLRALQALHSRAQLADRIRKFTERFAPMIRAMEGRRDRMLYNYI
jgi:hypothetical protein